MLSGELGVFQAFLARWHPVATTWMFLKCLYFMTVAKYTCRTSILSQTGGESVSPCEVMLQVAGMTLDCSV